MKGEEEEHLLASRLAGPLERRMFGTRVRQLWPSSAALHQHVGPQELTWLIQSRSASDKLQMGPGYTLATLAKIMKSIKILSQTY